jgi:ATP-dependent exoDNAse (exonuclease V) alpha subunit
MPDFTNIEINDEFKQALHLMNETNENVFLTGRAGTGKTTLLNYFRETTKKNIVILAPTGVAAVNVKGQTIHSFFKFGIDITPDRVQNLHQDDESEEVDIYKKLDTIIIDEVSMVRADLLDCVDKFMRLNGTDRKKPFGGVQMIFVGDLYQLPPVVTGDDGDLFETYYQSPYFFSSKVFDKIGFRFVELTKIYRQTDHNLIEILNAVRLGTMTEDHLKVINSRHCPMLSHEHNLHVRLMTTNAMADSYNEARLRELKGDTCIFMGFITGKFKRNFPTNLELKLKKGARVMMLTNEERWINGDLAEVIEVNDDDNEITVKLEDGGAICNIVPHKWEMLRFYYNKASKRVESEVIGTFTQFPMRLAWALTIHKGQGKTYSHVIVDFGRGTFAHGQAYVALSRCKNLEGLVLKRPLEHNHVMVDERIVEFMNACEGQQTMLQ